MLHNTQHILFWNILTSHAKLILQYLMIEVIIKREMYKDNS